MSFLVSIPYEEAHRHWGKVFDATPILLCTIRGLCQAMVNDLLAWLDTILIGLGR